MSNQTTSKLGALTKLPRELRDTIYRILIHTGDLNVLSVSKTMSEEASESFFKDRACRMNFGYNTRTPTFFPTQELATKLQDITLNINYRCRSGSIFDGRFSSYGLWERCDRSDIEHIRKFAGSDIPWKLCIVSFVVYASALQLFDPHVLEVVKLLTSFEKVILESRIEILSGILYSQSWKKGRLLGEERFSVKEMLEPTLGPAELVLRKKFKGRHPYRQTYRPRKYVEDTLKKRMEAEHVVTPG